MRHRGLKRSVYPRFGYGVKIGLMRVPTLGSFAESRQVAVPRMTFRRERTDSSYHRAVSAPHAESFASGLKMHLPTPAQPCNMMLLAGDERPGRRGRAKLGQEIAGMVRLGH